MSEIRKLRTDSLHFDIANPRLCEFGITESTPQNELLDKLWGAMGAEEILLSIAASGFFPHEPLIVIPKSKIPDEFVVVEGNRRLAAVRVIRDPEFLKKYSSTRLPNIREEIRAQLEELPCLIVKSREEVWQFLGFKHVNGAAKWSSYAKAKFIAQVHHDYGLPIVEIAGQIGDTSKVAQKLYRAQMVIEQAEKNKIFDLGDINAPRLYFSHLYNGLNLEGIKSFVRLREFSEELKEPVPADKLEELEELLVWMFGSKKNQQIPIVTSQNPDLKILSDALKNKDSISALRDGQSLEIAHEISLPDPHKFQRSLSAAKRSLYDAQKYVALGYDGKDIDLLKTAGSIANLADKIYSAMEDKHFESNKKDKNRISE